MTMEPNIWIDVLKVVAGILAGGGGIWAWVKAREDKRKTPYDMLRDLLAEQKKFYEARNADYEREKLDSAEKSAVLAATHKCAHRFKDPDIHCPVEEANEERLKNRCSRCKYNEEDEKD